MAQQEPPTERDILVGYLDGQRRHLLDNLDRLDEDVLHHPMFPSQWNCTALVHHLTMDVERWWFRAIIAGEQDVIEELTSSTEEAWHIGSRLPAEQVLTAYREEIERANAILMARAMDDQPAWWPTDLFGDFRLHTIREIVLHVMVETAAHAGHLDIVRELIDGKQWRVMTVEPD